MDYGASINESEDPAASPWGSSPVPSPDHSRTGFASIPGGTDNSSFSYSPQHGGLEASGDGDGFQRPGTATTESGTEGGDLDRSASLTSPVAVAESASESHPPASQAHQPAGDAQARASGVSRLAEQARQHSPAQKKPHFKLQAKINGLERTGKKDPVLRFDVHTNLPAFRTTQYRDVRRLHSEFVKLGQHLISANPEALVPAVPPPVTAAGAGTDEDENRIKAMMQRWVNTVCSNEVLMKDDEMVLFIESDFGYSPLVKMKQPATGVRRKILKQFAPPPDDTPELADARPTVKLFYLGTMDAGHKVDKMVKARRGLGLAESDYGVKLSSMNVQEPHPGLANAYKKLGRVIQTMGDYHAAQATAQAASVGDPFQYHSQDAFIVKESLTNRQILIREFLQSQEATRSKLNAADRLKASSSVRREKVDEAITALDEARQFEASLYNKTHRVTNNLIHERRRWFARTAEDLRTSIRDYVLREIDAERRTLALLETVRPDIRSIDASGGLSRLGRETHPTVRRSSLASSQGPKGDAWSGVPRRLDATRSASGGLMGKVAEEAEGTEADAREGQKVSVLEGLIEEDDDDRIDARNAASRLATSTF
ncbi:Vacuolar protein sorting-associated protein 17 [Metarhizium rileyi]|uniref:Vacuolar protein sorting-associated protein 17 n=1 Tax=Metarhizium rileyi (strain RCEF 4871) TaxID=1649241 RepID=A0A5C6G6E0_METRR|nr:Vacuolar protein sorting-associated protein 17 [Metarhizium rileyi]